MAVQAQHLAHAFHHHDSRAISRSPLHDAPTAFLGEPATGGHLLFAAAQQQRHQVGGTTVFSDPRSDLTCSSNNNNNLHDGVCFFAPPRKRARTGGEAAGAGLTTMDAHRALLPLPAPVPQAFPTAGDAQLQSSRVLCSAGASTSGSASTPAAASHRVLSHLYRHGVEVDALVRIQSERLRAGLEEARRRHVRAVVSAAARRLRAAEADLERALARGAELGERLRQVGAEGQAWRGVAAGHEAAAAGLRATLDQLLLQAPPPCAGGHGEAEAEDARSCCFGPGREEVDGAGAGGDQAAGRSSRACRSCGGAEACVLVLPCRHLCLCGVCEADVEACPVCAAAKNASIHVLLS
ncbi:unnamed protein product [Urochloa decumbens]|uniref:RING-type domain-containing protein n=1 Tax=Urochloa decumbens TaxID=240449 RepID=A0ABC8ZYV5_9POAL